MDSPQKSFRGPWIIAACFFTFGLSTGFPYYNIAFFFDYFRDDHGWTQQFVTFGAPVAVLLMLWVGPVMDKLGAASRVGGAASSSLAVTLRLMVELRPAGSGVTLGLAA